MDCVRRVSLGIDRTSTASLIHTAFYFMLIYKQRVLVMFGIMLIGPLLTSQVALANSVLLSCSDSSGWRQEFSFDASSGSLNGNKGPGLLEGRSFDWSFDDNGIKIHLTFNRSGDTGAESFVWINRKSGGLRRTYRMWGWDHGVPFPVQECFGECIVGQDKPKFDTVGFLIHSPRRR
jgi:hypothetical protein